MKKIIFTLLVFTTLFTTAKAEIFNFGVTAGMNITKGEVSTKTSYKGWSPDTENGWFAGLQLRCSFPIIGLGMDASLIYSQESISLPVAQVGAADAVTTETEKLNYLAVPLHLRYDLNIPGANLLAVPFVFLGPQANLAVSKLDQEYREVQKINAKDLVWRFDLGGGLLLLKHLQAAYSYSFPLSDTYEGDIFDKSDKFSSDYKQGVHRISLTYFF